MTTRTSSSISPTSETLFICALKRLLVTFCIHKCRGADIHLPDVENDTPLMIAAYDGHADVVRLLIELGARLDELDKVKIDNK